MIAIQNSKYDSNRKQGYFEEENRKSEHKNGGSDGARTRNIHRDRVAL